MKKLYGIIILTVMIHGCDSSEPMPGDNQSLNQDSDQLISAQSAAGYTVKIGEMYTYTDQSKRARFLNYRNDLWEFRGDGKLLRMAGRFEHEQPEVDLASIDLEYNNVYLEFMHPINGKNTRVSCKAKHEPLGKIVRTINTDNSGSGYFELVFEICRNTYTEEPISEIETPLLVSGQFNQLTISESLF